MCLLLAIPAGASAQADRYQLPADTSSAPVLTLEDCRALAISRSATSRMSEEAKLAAQYNRQAALAAMFPKVSANAAYMWNSSDAHLLASQTDFSFGTAGVGADGSSWFEWNDGTALGQMAQLSQGTLAGNEVNSLQQQAGQQIADAYGQLYDALTVEMTHVVVGQVGITQPLYLGGRLREVYNIAKATERMAGIQADSKHDDIILAADEAYWRVVSVEQKQQLAHYYYDLLQRLDSDVMLLAAEGMCTQSDLLKVHAKLGEAEVKRLQADNGIILARMALCQVCGLPLDSLFMLDRSRLSEAPLADPSFSAADAVENRTELQLLQEAEKIAHSNTRIMAAGLKPNIVAQAGYIYTNPYASDGLSNDWRNHGFFSAGVVVNVPIVHADDILRLKAAKHEEKMVSLKVDEARELLTLQTTQANQKLLEANQKVALAMLNVRNSEEVLRMAEESFRAGMCTASDLMQAQTAWLSASSDRIDAEIDVRIADSYLKKYTNQL